MADNISIFGVRHHGPGTARSLLQALRRYAPDCVLIEGPPEADDLIRLAGNEDMAPPVALMLYSPDTPALSAFYPFAEFSPEWQAIKYALEHDIPVRFMDFPQSHRLAILKEENEKPGTGDTPDEETDEENAASDPIGAIGRAAGYADGEDWWEHVVEQRLDGADQFSAIAEAMAIFREDHHDAITGDKSALLEARREAYMRKTIRAAKKEGFHKIAAVCGAWHVPALENSPPVKDDNQILKGLPKIKVNATWIPWTYNRLTFAGGYGAGVRSPGWYHHLWKRGGSLEDKTAGRSEVITRWLVQVARLMRRKDYDISTAHVIETRRTAETLTALRDKALPGLDEINESIVSVMLFGDPFPMTLIQNELIISDRMGKVPADTPTVPLQQDIEKQQKTLRMKPAADSKILDLDLRKPNDLARSHFLHRLSILKINWADMEAVGRQARGTFHEIWTLQWKPELALEIIEASIWGNTVLEAAGNYALKTAAESNNLRELAELIDQVMLAEMQKFIQPLVHRLDSIAALSNDVAGLMDAVPPLANILRYGNVRGTDTGMIRPVIHSMAARICIGLPGACSSLDDDAAAAYLEKIQRLHSAVKLIQIDDLFKEWLRTLGHLADMSGMHGLIAGYCCRLLLDSEVFSSEDASSRMSLSLSTANDPLKAAAWMEGFLRGSGMLLVHDDRIWSILNLWVSSISEDRFNMILPLVRRAFSLFNVPERKQIGQKARQFEGKDVLPVMKTAKGFNLERAGKVLPVIRRLYGIEE